MVKIRISRLLFIAVVAGAMTENCYTKFATFEQREIAPGTDSVKTEDKEVCIWERDLMGFPYLHCYPGYYPRQWYINNSPWWYHNNEHLYNADQCPPYYYFDPNCGCCRYYLNNPALSRASYGNQAENAQSSVQSTNARGYDSNRVNISTSSHSTIYAPLYGNRNSTMPPVTGQPSPASSAMKPDSLKVRDSVSADTASPPPKRPQRSMRGR